MAGFCRRKGFGFDPSMGLSGRFRRRCTGIDRHGNTWGGRAEVEGRDVLCCTVLAAVKGTLTGIYGTCTCTRTVLDAKSEEGRE